MSPESPLKLAVFSTEAQKRLQFAEKKNHWGGLHLQRAGLGDYESGAEESCELTLATRGREAQKGRAAPRKSGQPNLHHRLLEPGLFKKFL